jgi:hypothetical protein
MMAGRSNRLYPVNGDVARDLLRAGYDTAGIAAFLNEVIAGEGLDYEQVTEARVYNAIARGDDRRKAAA